MSTWLFSASILPLALAGFAHLRQILRKFDPGCVTWRGAGNGRGRAFHGLTAGQGQASDCERKHLLPAAKHQCADNLSCMCIQIKWHNSPSLNCESDRGGHEKCAHMRAFVMEIGTTY